MSEGLPVWTLVLMIPFFIVSSYLMFNIPYFLHDGFQCCNCPCPGDQGRIWTNPVQRFYGGLAAMLNWWLAFFGLFFYYHKHPEKLDRLRK